MQPKYQLTNPYAGATRYFDDTVKPRYVTPEERAPVTAAALKGIKAVEESASLPALAAKYAYEQLPVEQRAMLETAGRMVGNVGQRIVQSEPVQAAGEVLGRVFPNAGKLTDYIGGSPADNPMFNLETGPGGLEALMAFHGTPHMFDKFNAKFIGTGEGAQMRGHGLYLAESPTVAGGYKKSTSAVDSAKQFLSELPEDADFSEIMDLANAGKLSPQNTRLLKALEKDDWLGFDYPSQAISSAFKYVDKHNFAMSPELKNAVHDYGYLYKTDIPDEWIPKMADWDVALNKQPKQVQKTAQKLFEEHIKTGAWSEENGGVKFGQFHDYLREKMSSAGDKNASQNISKAFADAGVPGIKYLDAGSRSAQEGTRNFVIFPGMEQDVKILERNGQPIEQKFAEGGSVHYADGGLVDRIAKLSRQAQFKVADLAKLGPEVRFATTAPEQYFPKEEQHNQRGDAMRHILLQAQLMQKHGENPAKIISWLHENLALGQGEAEKAMDLYNDELGREIGRTSKSKEEMVNCALQAIESGKAHTLAEGEGGYAEGGPVNTDDDDYGQPFGDEIAKLYQGGLYRKGGEVHKYIVTSLTPVQKRLLKAHHAELGDESSFDDWMSDAGIPAIIHGHATKSMDSFLTPEQREMLDQVNS